MKSGWSNASGYKVTLKDSDGLVHYYAHMMEQSILKAGDIVKAGDVLGKVGSTGDSTGNHLHYGIYKNKTPINPETYLKSSFTISTPNSSDDNKVKKWDELNKQVLQRKQDILQFQKELEEQMTKQAEAMIVGSDRILDDIEKSNTLLSTKQSLYQKTDTEYIEMESKKINNLLKQQVVIKRNAEQVRAILAENNFLISSGKDGFLSGDMIVSLNQKLKDLDNQFWQTEKTIRDSQKEQRLENLGKLYFDMELKIIPLTNALELLDAKFGLLADNDYSGKYDVLAESFDAIKSKVSLLRNEYSKLGNITPQTIEEAQDLADKMENTASQIFNANKAMLDYQKQLDMLKVEEMSYGYKNDFGKLNDLLGSFKHNLDMLDGGLMDGTDINFGIGVLPDIPKSALEEKRKELDSMIKEQRKYEEEILKIRQMSFEEQEKKNKTFLDAIKQYMTEHYGSVIDNTADSLGTQLNLQDKGQQEIYSAIIESLKMTEGAYNSSWDSIVAKVVASLAVIQQATAQAANETAKMYAYENYNSKGDKIGTTYGESGKSNAMSDAAYVIVNGKKYRTKKSSVNKYADGTDGHKGGVALVGEEGYELAIFPDNSTTLLGKNGAELVDLPKGTSVIPHDETRDIESFIGKDAFGSKVPKYSDGRIPKYAGGIFSKVVSSVVKATSKVVSSASSGRSSSSSSSSSSRQPSNQSSNNGKYQYANYDSSGRFLGFTSSNTNGKSNYLSNASYVVAPNGRSYSTNIKPQNNSGNSGGNSLLNVFNGIKNAGNALGNVAKTTANNFINAMIPQQEELLPELMMPMFGFLSANEDYYKQDKTPHQKEIDKIRYDSFLKKDTANEFKTYKTQRDSVMKAIETERDAIKKHFSNGGLRNTIESQIQSLMDKIDSQTAKDAEMQFKMSEDVLKQQKTLAENYMNKTSEAYLNGINSGMSVDSLRKLRDEYSDALNEFNNIEKAIKENAKARYDYEFAMIDKRMQKYEKLKNDTSFKLGVLNTATDGKDYKQQLKYNEDMVKTLKEQISALGKEYSDLQNQQKAFGVGSFEWNLHEAEIENTKKELQGLNSELIQTLANNKKIAKDGLNKAFESQNKELQKQLFDGKSQSEITRELEKAKKEHEKYLKGVEKEHALDLLIRDLKKEEITEFDKKIAQMMQSEKITRDEYTTLTKMIELKKMEVALDKLKNNKNIQQLKQSEDGSWNFEWVADENAIKELEDKLTEAKIDMLNWNKELEFKTKDMTLQEKLDFMDRLNEIQQKALNDEYKNSDEFVQELKKLGLSMSDYEKWAGEIQDKLINDNGQFKGLFDTMSKSFENYTSVINDLNKRLELLLVSLSVDKTINLNDALNGVQQFDTGGYTGDFNGGKLAILDQKELILNKVDTANILEAIKLIRGVSMSDLFNVKTPTINPMKSDVQNIFKIDEVTFPNAENVREIQEALLTLPQVAKQKANPNG